jgi:hypothetical protein
MGEVGGRHLLAKKFLVDEMVENGTAIVRSELGEGAVAEESFVAQGFVPVGLQNNMAVDRGDDAVDYFGGGALGRDESCDEEKCKRRDADYCSDMRSFYQNG